jgi:hypothetical protein
MHVDNDERASILRSADDINNIQLFPDFEGIFVIFNIISWQGIFKISPLCGNPEGKKN